MTLGMTLGQRIALAEKLPTRGTLAEMTAVANIKKVLVGFAAAQLISYRIVEYNDTFITALPSTATTVTLADELVIAFAKIIQRWSDLSQIGADFATIYQSILDEAEALTAVEEEDETTGDSVDENTAESGE